MSEATSESNGEGEYVRTEGGRFAAGTRAGPGRPPMSSPMGKFREVLWSEIKEHDIASAIQTLRDVMSDPKAKPADRIAAAREMLDRSAGRPLPTDLADLVEQAERLAVQRQEPEGDQ
jgi:hypothetical protein